MLYPIHISRGKDSLCVVFALQCGLHLNDMEIPETKRFIPKGSELGTTLS